MSTSSSSTSDAPTRSIESALTAGTLLRSGGVAADDRGKPLLIGCVQVDEPHPQVSGCPASDHDVTADRLGVAVDEQLEPELRPRLQSRMTLDQQSARAHV